SGTAAATESPGGVIYVATCAGCHEGSRGAPYGGINLALSTTVSGPDPRNLANIVLSGVRPVEGERSPIMPGFAASISAAQIAALVGYLWSRFTWAPEWNDIEKTIADPRRTQTAHLEPAGGPSNAPADPAQRDKP